MSSAFPLCPAPPFTSAFSVRHSESAHPLVILPVLSTLFGCRSSHLSLSYLSGTSLGLPRCSVEGCGGHDSPARWCRPWASSHRICGESDSHRDMISSLSSAAARRATHDLFTLKACRGGSQAACWTRQSLPREGSPVTAPGHTQGPPVSSHRGKE